MSDRKSRIQNQKSRVILITGASQGIGAAIAKIFAQEIRGVRLALVARNVKNLQAVARACEKSGAKVEIYECDVTNAASVDLMAAEVRRAFGAPDVLVNNAGAFTMAPFAETTLTQFDDMIAVNLRSAFLVTQAFLPAMLKRKSGDIFFMSSIAGLGAYPHSTAYCAAKFGVTGLAKVLRAETKDKGVRVCCVHPGATWSPSWEKSGVKPERIMPAEDIARAMLEVYRLSGRTVVEEIVLRPQLGDV
jgi:NAD(P)-dependent dehydrogenase (short-subunit alcohol dehydrogenase family)